jgi:DNA-binding response OmpR family regulator
VTVHVRRLREKVEADPARPALLSTVWGVGYRWEGS